MAEDTMPVAGSKDDALQASFSTAFDTMPPQSPKGPNTDKARSSKSKYKKVEGRGEKSKSDNTTGKTSSQHHSHSRQRRGRRALQDAITKIMAIALIGMFHLMIGIPFGVSYFPVGWREVRDTTSRDTFSTVSGGSENTADAVSIIPMEDSADEVIHGPFPLPGKEALGIRMFLYATIIGQVIYTFTSQFPNPIGLQMVENLPFYHELAAIVVARQGYGMDALSTLFFLFGLASVVVGLVFYSLGALNLGRNMYFFPSHVLVGCIGGIGVFIAINGLEISMDATVVLSNIELNWKLLAATLTFELVLRLLERCTRDAEGRPRYSLLSPIYFCMITPLFYLALWIMKIPMQQAVDDGFFFPPFWNQDLSSAVNGNSTGIENALYSIVTDDHLLDIWHIFDVRLVSWRAVIDAVPTLLALTLFSLIHVPIIPAIALSTHVDVDMNNELMAHGYSNVLAGVLGGLQNYMAYTQSVVYGMSGGTGRPSGIAVAVLTAFLFVVGPAIASYIPRCMAGTLLLHVGTDLFLEGVYDSYGKYDRLEYAGIWLIVVVMTVGGMDDAMIAGVIAAVSTYAAQSISYPNPIRGSMCAENLRSSYVNRPLETQRVLAEGRKRILVVQLQGHLFFGTMTQMSDSVNKLLSTAQPSIVILDFSLVQGIDSSAAQAISKLRTAMRKKHGVHLSIFVTGSEGFPCEIDLTAELSCSRSDSVTSSQETSSGAVVTESTKLLETHTENTTSLYTGSSVCRSLDDALIRAEEAILTMHNSTLLYEAHEFAETLGATYIEGASSLERADALRLLRNLCGTTVETKDLDQLFTCFQRESYIRGDFLWKQGDDSDSAKLIVSGTMLALKDNDAVAQEYITAGTMIGELGLVHGDPRMSSVQCISDEAVVYSISRESFEALAAATPRVARLLDMICIEILTNRVQHVSGRIFESRCLPV